MAKITFTIEDVPEKGSVRFTSEPSFETMIKRLQSGHELTAAMGYACFVMNQLQGKSKELARENRHAIVLPKLVT